LERRGNTQTIMLGFSDGTKDGGYLQANYSIYEAKKALTTISRKHGIEVIFFDGRGGPPGRGGGNTHDFYASLGSEIENVEIELTVQGQTISANFGKVVSCKYNIEQLLTAGFENDLYANRMKALSDSEQKLLQELAHTSFESYKALKSDPAFVPYLNRATPLQFFGKTNIGSRPVKRSGDGDFKFEDLRAIPFVGSWAQIKQNVPGFYGFGSAIAEMRDRNRLPELKALYKNSLFFRALVGNSMQSLAKAFYPATAYQQSHSEFGPLWHKIHDEYNLTVKELLSVSEQKVLLGDNVLSRESIKLREQIVLPLITIQQFALQKLLSENTKMDDKELIILQQLILRCMYGIINAARNAA
jgi:phosphoenolpyruvate carboxylase